MPGPLPIDSLPAIPAPLTGTENLAITQAGATYRIQSSELNMVKRVKVSIPSAAVLTLNSVPVFAIAAPGVGYAIRIVAFCVRTIFGSVPYATNVDLSVYNLTANNTQGYCVGALNATVDSIRNGNIELAGFATDTQIMENDDIYISNPAGDPTAGDSDIDVYIDYEIIKL